MPVKILSTSLLDEQLINDAPGQDVHIDVVSFTEIRMADMKLVHSLVTQVPDAATVVFTSANAVRAVGSVENPAKSSWNIYCIGLATKNEVLKYFAAGQIVGSAQDATGLAALMLAEHVKDAFFFCGNMRMDALPDTLQHAGVFVHELVVYETVIVPESISEQYDGILFYSPSGVAGFFERNNVQKKTILFAIGNTTAAAIKAYTDNEILISSFASKAQIVADAVRYFTRS
jgi:uroporphyrinogen-III synthase